MASVRSIRRVLTGKVNMGNYESVDVTVEYVLDVVRGDDINEVSQRLHARMCEELQDQMNDVREFSNDAQARERGPSVPTRAEPARGRRPRR